MAVYQYVRCCEGSTATTHVFDISVEPFGRISLILATEDRFARDESCQANEGADGLESGCHSESRKIRWLFQRVSARAIEVD